MAELFGKATGTNKGKGGSMHICDPSIGNLGANGIVAAGIPIATGAALSSKLRKSGQVAVCFFGDGATNQGAFHESLNIASIWKLPVVYVCENNQYGMGTPLLQSTSVDDLSVRAKSYGIPGIIVDGMDVQSIYEAVNEAVENARKGYGPTLIVCNTYRYYGHFGFLPIASFTRGRTKEEINEWKKQDPIETLKTRLIVNGVISERRADELFKSVKEEIEKAVQFAKESPDPAPEEALQDIYYE
jgi:TPP-dependent pyruvate/acetoin dehydrogenase alpha subunit